MRGRSNDLAIPPSILQSVNLWLNFSQHEVKMFFVRNLLTFSIAFIDYNFREWSVEYPA